MKEAAAPAHVCPAIGLHAIDIVQPPGISISPVADIEVHQMVVTTVQMTESIVTMPTKVRREAFSETR
jgi:hypothetical protein